MATKQIFGAQTEEELRFGPTVVLAGLAATAMTVVLAADWQPTLEGRDRMLIFGLVAYVVLGGCMLLRHRRVEEQRWLWTVAPALLLAFGLVWLRQPGLLALAPLPVVLGLALNGFQGAALAAVIQSAALGAAAWPAASWLPNHTLALALTGVWATAGLLFGLYRQMLQITDWSWHNYRQVLRLLEEARDRKAELEQVLDELVHSNRQMDLLNERLAATRLMAEEAHKAKAAFVAKVSHEFRTPLNMIIGLTDLIMETPDVYGTTLPPSLLEDIRIVHRNCAHLASMINDVLDLSQTESGRLALRREWVDLREEIATAAMVVQPLIEKKGLALELCIAEQLPEVYCDRTRIRQVVLNLVSNAARYTERGRIRVTAEPVDASVVVGVEDTGPGIPPAEAEKIFEPFYQGINGAWRDRSGSGLGLTISRQFIELHGGAIWVQSEVGRGSHFAFRLPIFPAAPPHATSGRWIHEEWPWLERPERPAIPRLPYRQRLLVWDQAGELVEEFVQQTDEVEFVSAANLEEMGAALDECPAHAIVVNAPTPDQLWPLLDYIRQAADETPVIGYCLPERSPAATASDVVDYLTKPITRADLRKALGSLKEKPQRVLTVDDNPEFRQLLARMIHTLDPAIQVFETGNSEEALEFMHTQRPDLVFLDIAMPDLDGWQLLAAKNQDAKLAGIHVTIVSAQDPMDQPLQSGLLVVTMGDGLPFNKLLPCSLAVAELLLNPEPPPDPMPESVLDGEPAWAHSR